MTLMGTVNLELGHKPYLQAGASVPRWAGSVRLQGFFGPLQLDPGRPTLCKDLPVNVPASQVVTSVMQRLPPV